MGKERGRGKTTKKPTQTQANVQVRVQARRAKAKKKKTKTARKEEVEKRKGECGRSAVRWQPECGATTDFPCRCKRRARTSAPQEITQDRIRKWRSATAPNERELLLLPFCAGWNSKRDKRDTPTLYAKVPANTVRMIVEKHQGLATNSGNLPSLIEADATVDEDGYQWAAAAAPPTTEESDVESSDGSEDSMAAYGSPTSAVHMGAPPPPPPPWPPTTAANVGAVSPPPTFTAITLSPIMTHIAPTTENPPHPAEMNDLGEAVLYVNDADVGDIPTGSDEEKEEETQNNKGN